jgi:hypothetical protein
MNQQQIKARMMYMYVVNAFISPEEVKEMFSEGNPNVPVSRIEDAWEYLNAHDVWGNLTRVINSVILGISYGSLET